MLSLGYEEPVSESPVMWDRAAQAARACLSPLQEAGGALRGTDRRGRVSIHRCGLCNVVLCAKCCLPPRIVPLPETRAAEPRADVRIEPAAADGSSNAVVGVETVAPPGLHLGSPPSFLRIR